MFQLLIPFDKLAANIVFPWEFRCKAHFLRCLSLIVLLPRTRNLILAEFIELFTWSHVFGAFISSLLSIMLLVMASQFGRKLLTPCFIDVRFFIYMSFNNESIVALFVPACMITLVRSWGSRSVKFWSKSSVYAPGIFLSCFRRNLLCSITFNRKSGESNLVDFSFLWFFST